MKKIYNTTVKTKAKYYKKFVDLVGGQFLHGGEKYKLEGFDGMEATDLISKLWEKPGEGELKWVLKTCVKYLCRFQNFHREKDLLKIACYMYIVWLKMGFHTQKVHNDDTKKDG